MSSPSSSSRDPYMLQTQAQEVFHDLCYMWDAGGRWRHNYAFGLIMSEWYREHGVRVGLTPPSAVTEAFHNEDEEGARLLSDDLLRVWTEYDLRLSYDLATAWNEYFLMERRSIFKRELERRTGNAPLRLIRRLQRAGYWLRERIIHPPVTQYCPGPKDNECSAES